MTRTPSKSQRHLESRPTGSMKKHHRQNLRSSAMSKIANRTARAVMILITMTIATISPLRAQDSAAPPAAPDATLYTTYSAFASSGQTTISWTVCGSTQDDEGCYDSGSIGPFLGVGAMLEGDPSIKGNVVTRLIYVVDSGSATSVKLYVYRKVDTITAEFDTTTVTLARTVKLPLTGGSTALCSMAANQGFLFIGTDQSPQAVSVKKSTLGVTTLGGFSPPLNVLAITADQYGYVTVTQGNSSGGSGFAIFSPAGEGVEEGGGADFLLDTMQGISPAPLLGTNAQSVPRRGHQPKASHAEAAAN
jgi:hypothetical protein